MSEMEKQINQIQFYDNAVPGLRGGEYTIHLRQELQADGTKEFTNQRRFQVHISQFALQSADLYTVYPPSGAAGDFTQSLPQVVLTGRTLPWTRTADAAVSGEIPWLGVLTVTADELVPGAGGASCECGAVRTTIGELLTPTPKTLIPPITLESGVSRKETCYYIELRREIFSRLMPSLDEIRYLAHCRTVNTEQKAARNRKHDGDFSVVLGNRLPQVRRGETVCYYAHLVSLEGFAPYLQGGPHLPEEYETARLISLHRWSFTVRNDARTDFAAAFRRLVQGETPPAQQDLLLRLPVPGDAPEPLKSRLINGYVPLPYHVYSGEDTMAWYRGPFAPVSTEAVYTGREPFLSAADAMILEEQTGMFDLSLAVAWQIGQEAALADKQFVRKLRQLYIKGQHAVDLVFSRSRSPYFTAGGDDNLRGLREQQLNDNFAKGLNQELALGIQKLNQDLTNRPPSPSPQEESASPFVTDSEDAGDERMALADFYRREDLYGYLADSLRDEIRDAADWLSELRLLYKIPFYHLVPHPDLLPPESIRFFYIDENWLSAMFDGALSPGMQSGRDEMLYRIIKDQIEEGSARQSMQLRNKLRGVLRDTAEHLPFADKMPVGGFFIRSALLTDWPGLEITAFRGDHTGLPILRMDCLAPDLLCVIFSGIPAELQFHEPAEGIGMGIGESLTLRRVQGEESGLGEKVGEFNPKEMMDPATGVIRVGRLARELRKCLQVPEAGFGSAAFAMQLVDSPRQLIMKAHNEGGER